MRKYKRKPFVLEREQKEVESTCPPYHTWTLPYRWIGGVERGYPVRIEYWGVMEQEEYTAASCYTRETSWVHCYIEHRRGFSVKDNFKKCSLEVGNMHYYRCIFKKCTFLKVDLEETLFEECTFIECTSTGNTPDLYKKCRFEGCSLQKEGVTGVYPLLKA